MTQLSEHPTVKQFRERVTTDATPPRPESLAREWLRQVCLEAGADDAGFVEIDRFEIADQKSEILSLLPGTKTLVSLVMRMNRENIRTPARSIANLEFHHTTDETNEVARKLLRRWKASGCAPSMAEPKASLWRRIARERKCGSSHTNPSRSLQVWAAWESTAM